jgi:hypothetical protein
MRPDICLACGGNLALIGRMHRCIPQHVAVPEPMLPLPTPAERYVANKPISHLANTEGVANGLANTSLDTHGRNRASTTYRYRNPDRRRAYQRNLMRRRRATGKAA